MPDYKKAARRAAVAHGVNPGIFLAMIEQESGFNPNVSSPAGAQGIAQFIPSTAKAYGVNLNDGRVSDDLDGAARYLKANLKRTGGNYDQALSIYNSGRPDGYKRIPETINYVKNIRALSKKYGVNDPQQRSGSTGPVPTGGDQGSTTTTGAGFDAGQASALAEMVRQQSRPQAPVSAPQAPAFSAQAPMPTGYQAPSAQPVQSSGGSSLADQLQAIGHLQGQSIPQVDVKTTRTGGSQQGASATPSGARSGLKGLVPSVQYADRLAAKLGVPVTAKQEPGHQPGGDHDPAVKGASARDYGGSEQARERMFRQITRQLGVNGAEYKGADINIVKNGVRWQIISRDHGSGPHLHIGWRKAA